MERILFPESILIRWTFLFGALFFSCNQPTCENTNAIFNSYDPETSEYKNELIRQLQTTNSNELSYWFERYEVKDRKEYMLVDINAKEWCAKGFILVIDWGKLEGIKQSKGRGYTGAELKGLKIDFRSDSVHTELIVKDVESIID